MDVHKAHELSETHHAVGKIVLQIRKSKDGPTPTMPTFNQHGFAKPSDMDEQMQNVLNRGNSSEDLPQAPARRPKGQVCSSFFVFACA